MRQILPLVTAFSFTVSHHVWRRGFLHWNICAVKAKRSHSASTWTRMTTVQSITINADQRAPNGLLFHDAPCGQSFFLTRPSLSIFPHSYTNSPLTRTENCDFRVFLLLVPSPAPCLVLTQAAPLSAPLQPWEEEAHAWAMTGAH